MEIPTYSALACVFVPVAHGDAMCDAAGRYDILSKDDHSRRFQFPHFPENQQRRIRL